MYGKGISKVGELIDLGTKAGVVKNLVHGMPTKVKRLDKVEKMQKFILKKTKILRLKSKK